MQILEQYIENAFSGAKDSEIIRLLKELKRLVPGNLNNKEGINYLLDIMSYVDGMINGDDIIQYTTQKYTTEYAKKALMEIASEVRDETLEAYRLELISLREDITSLSKEKESLEKTTLELRNERATLIKDNTATSQELKEVRQALKNEKDNGMATVQKDIEDERKRLENELSSLKDEKESLSNELDNLKESIASYHSFIEKCSSENGCQVSWETIKDDDPIYNVNYLTVEEYIKSLILTYQDKMGVTYSDSEREFSKNCPGIKEFIKIVKDFNNKSIKSTGSLRGIVKDTDWNNDGQHKASILKAFLKSAKLPVYRTSRNNNIDCVNPETLPNDIKTLLRELHLNRITMEAITKQRILENELKIVIGILKNVLPPDYDLTKMLTIFGDKELIEDIKPELESSTRTRTNTNNLN